MSLEKYILFLHPQVPSRNLDIAIEQLPYQTGPSPSSSHDVTPYTSPSHYATPSSVRSTMRYTEIDVSLYDNPRLKSHKEEDVDMGKGEGEGAEPETQRHRHRKPKVKPKVRKNWPHEELLLFVGKEWKDLTVEVTIYRMESTPAQYTSLYLLSILPQFSIPAQYYHIFPVYTFLVYLPSILTSQYTFLVYLPSILTSLVYLLNIAVYLLSISA